MYVHANLQHGRRGLYSSVAERQSCKLKVLGSIPSEGCFLQRAQRYRNHCALCRCPIRHHPCQPLPPYHRSYNSRTHGAIDNCSATGCESFLKQLNCHVSTSQHCVNIVTVLRCSKLSTIHSGYHCSSDPVQVQSLKINDVCCARAACVPSALKPRRPCGDCRLCKSTS